MPFIESIRTAERFAGDAGEVLVELYDYDSEGNLVYTGVCSRYDAPVDEDVWYVTKYEYDAEGNVARKQVRQRVAWVDRALLDWL